MVPRRMLAVLAAGALLAGACGSSSNDNDNAVGGDGDKPAVGEGGDVDSDRVANGALSLGATSIDDPVDGGRIDVSYEAAKYPSELGSLIDIAVTDLAERLGVQADTIQVAFVQEVVWSNASWGCPVPGMSYAAETVDGLRIVLERSAVTYDYRSGGLGSPTLCLPEDQRVPFGGGDPGLGPGLDVSVSDDGEVTAERVTPEAGDDKTTETNEPTEGTDPPDE